MNFTGSPKTFDHIYYSEHYTSLISNASICVVTVVLVEHSIIAMETARFPGMEYHVSEAVTMQHCNRAEANV